jgi:hypothetical protein
MNYIDIDKYEAKWMFTNPNLPVSKADIIYIRPLDEKSSREIWSRYISEFNRHPMLIENHEWTSLNDTWIKQDGWQYEWNSDRPEPPILLKNTETWQENDIVYFMYMRESVIETTWAVFLRNWKCFLFDDEGPFLFNPRNSEIYQFGPSGKLLYGKKRANKAISADAKSSAAE